MNWKKKLTSRAFWISLAGAVVVMLQCFGLKIDAPYVNEAISAVCSVCIILGLMRDDSSLISDLPDDELPDEDFPTEELPTEDFPDDELPTEDLPDEENEEEL